MLTATDARHGTAHPGAEGPGNAWWECRFAAMGSQVHLVGLGGPDDAPTRARRRVEQLEAAWSRFRPDAELARLNRDPRREVEVSADLALALRRAVVAWALTGGWCDASVHDALVGAGYDRPWSELRSRPAHARRPGAPTPGLGEVEVDPDRGTVRRPPGLRLDLGGIGKGLAADVVAVELRASGVRAVAVSVGGDVRTSGRRPDDAWRVPVEVAGHRWTASPGTGVGGDSGEGGLAASTTVLRRWPTDRGMAHHLIDPGTGEPSTSALSAVVVAGAEAWWSECLAKAVLLAGPDRGSELLDAAGARGWLVAGADRSSQPVVDPAAERPHPPAF